MSRSDIDLRPPTVVTDDWWIHAFAHDRPTMGDRPGKWLVFLPVRYVDQYWTVVADAVRARRLGPTAKAATVRPNPNSADPTRRVIVVYTTDWCDEDDVRRVLRELRGLGISWRLAYKTDDDTHSGIYGRDASTYTSPSGSVDLRRRS